MRRRLAVFAGVASVVFTLVFVSPEGASADLCVGSGIANVNPGLLAPGQPIVFTSGGTTVVTLLNDGYSESAFAFSLSVGACVPLTNTFNASGVLRGYCGHSVGWGLDTFGHLFGWMEVGSYALVTGGLTGMVGIKPDPLVPGNSCTSPTGATQFLVSGAVHRTGCEFFDVLPQTPFGTSGIHLISTTIGTAWVTVRVPGAYLSTNGHVCAGLPL